MRANHKHTICGKDLLEALQSLTPETKIKWISKGFDELKEVWLSQAEALCIVKAIPYEAKVNKKRIIFIREINNFVDPTFDHAYREGRAVLQMLPGTSNAVKIWDKFFTTHPTVHSAIVTPPVR